MKQLFDQIDFPQGAKGLVIHVYDGVEPPTYLVEMFHTTRSDTPQVITLQEQIDGSLRRLSPSLKEIPDARGPQDAPGQSPPEA